MDVDEQINEMGNTSTNANITVNPNSSQSNTSNTIMLPIVIDCNDEVQTREMYGHQDVVDVEALVPVLMDLQRDTSFETPIDVETFEPGVAKLGFLAGRRQSRYPRFMQEIRSCISECESGSNTRQKPSINRYVDIDKELPVTKPRNDLDSPLRCPICMRTFQKKTDQGSAFTDSSKGFFGEDGSIGQSPQSWSATKCGHIFCRSCINFSLKTKKSCPVCRTDLKGKSDIIPLFV